MQTLLRAQDLESFARDGYVVLRNFYDIRTEIADVKRGIHRLAGLLGPASVRQFLEVPYSDDRFDESILDSLQSDRKFAGFIYDAIKKLPAYVRLACARRHEEVSAKLLQSDFIGFANRGYGMRMDAPHEDEMLTQLHQDYVSQLCSPAGVVFWSPLRDVTNELGPLKVYPGSHRHGVFPIEKRAAGSRGLVIRDEDLIRSRFPVVSILPKVGDVVAAHHLLLHESSKNRSQHIRWSMISRYFDLLHPEGQRIKWAGGLQDGNSFESIYPEFAASIANR